MIRVLFCDSSHRQNLFSPLFPSWRLLRLVELAAAAVVEEHCTESFSSAGADCQIIGKPKDRVECFSNIPSFLQQSYDQHLSQRLACNQTIVVVLQLHEDVATCNLPKIQIRTIQYDKIHATYYGPFFRQRMYLKKSPKTCNNKVFSSLLLCDVTGNISLFCMCGSPEKLTNFFEVGAQSRNQLFLFPSTLL